MSADGGDIDGPARAVVALCDAMMTRPGDVSPAIVDELRRHFSAGQLVEMTLKVMKFNIQKTMVALGTDAAITEDQIDKLVWNADGQFVLA